MKLQGQTVYVVTTEGAYPGNSSAPQIFADEQDAQTYASKTEATLYGNPPRQQYWCEVEPMEIR